MSHDDNRPDILRDCEWVTLPDGREQMTCACESVAAFILLPKVLVIGDTPIARAGWDSDKKIAFYRQPETPDALEDLLSTPPDEQ